MDILVDCIDGHYILYDVVVEMEWITQTIDYSFVLIYILIINDYLITYRRVLLLCPKQKRRDQSLKSIELYIEGAH